MAKNIPGWELFFGIYYPKEIKLRRLDVVSFSGGIKRINEEHLIQPGIKNWIDKVKLKAQISFFLVRFIQGFNIILFKTAAVFITEIVTWFVRIKAK